MKLGAHLEEIERFDPIYFLLGKSVYLLPELCLWVWLLLPAAAAIFAPFSLLLLLVIN